MAEAVDPKVLSANSTSVVDKLHSMPWLKINASINERDTKPEENDGRFPRSKNDEDYFPGTKEVKKGKKKREKRGKVVLDLDNLNDYMTLTNQKIPHAKKCEESLPNICHTEKQDTQKPLGTSSENADQVETIWTTNTSTANKLFPNVNSVRIDRMEEEEMLSMALAESIITIQLEQFKKTSPEKVKGRWEELYEDSDDGGWDNVRRNLPPADIDTQSCKEQDANNSRSLRDNRGLSGILRNKESYSASLVYNLPAFQFEQCSESSQEELKTTRSGKSVVFSDSVSAKTASSESSKNDEHYEQLSKESGNMPGKNNMQPDIDKYGRIGGYSERRLFMGKGARMKEQLYLAQKYGLKSSSQLVAQSIPALPHPKNLESKTSINTAEESSTQKATLITKKTQIDPKMTTKDSDTKIVDRNANKTNICEVSSKFLSEPNSGNESTMKSSVGQVTQAKLEPQKSVSKELATQSKPQVLEMVEMTHKVVEEGILIKKTPIEVKQDTCAETDLSNKQKIHSAAEKQEKPSTTTNSLNISSSLRNENIPKNDAVHTEDSLRLVQTNDQRTTPTKNDQNLTTNFSDIVNRMIDNDVTEIPDSRTETDSDTRCLVAVAQGIHGCTSNTSATNPPYTEPPPAMVLATKCPNPACQNLHLAGVVNPESFCSHLNYATENYQNVQNFVNNNYPLQRLQPALCSASSNKSSPQTFSDINHDVSYAYPNVPPEQSCIQNTYPMNMAVPTYVNVLQHGYLAHSVPLHHTPYETDSFLMDNAENILSISGIQELPTTPQHSESPFEISAANDPLDGKANRVPQAPPGFVEKLQLLPDSEKTLSPAQSPPLHKSHGKPPYQRGTSRKNSSGIGQQETAKPQTREKGKIPYAILGASQSADQVHVEARPAKNRKPSNSGSKKHKNIARSNMNNNYLSLNNPSTVTGLYYRSTNVPLPNTIQYPHQNPHQSEVNAPMYYVPHMLDVQSNVDQNLRYESRNCDPYAAMNHPITSQPMMQCQLIETDMYADYNMNQLRMGQFMPDVSASSYAPQAVPTTENTPVFIEPRIGRGRGRLTQRDFL